MTTTRTRAKPVVKPEPSPTPRFLTMSNAVVTLVLSCLVIISLVATVAFSTNNRLSSLEYIHAAHADGYGRIGKLEDRLTVTDYQQQIDIADREAIHMQLDRHNNDLTLISNQLARMDVNIQTLLDREKKK